MEQFDEFNTNENDEEARLHRIRNRKKSDAAKLAWKRNHYSYMRAMRKRERDNMNKQKSFCDMYRDIRLSEAELTKDNVFEKECEINLENIAGGLKLSINNENGNLSISTTLLDSGSGQYRLESFNNEKLKELYEDMKEELIQLCNSFDNEIAQLVAKNGLKSTK